MDLSTLIATLRSSGSLSSSAVERAFLTIDRADFVSESGKSFAYIDHALSIGEGQTISQPTVVAMMLEALNLTPGQKVLDVGSGSGWTTALIAQIIGKDGRVIGVERIPRLVAYGQRNLKKYRLNNAKIVQVGEELGLPSNAPFDRILVSATAKKIPQSLLDQLKPGGRMVLPVRDWLYVVNKSKNGDITINKKWGFAFVPLIESQKV